MANLKKEILNAQFDWCALDVSHCSAPLVSLTHFACLAKAGNLLPFSESTSRKSLKKKRSVEIILI